MKYFKLNTNVVLVLVTTILIATGTPSFAEEKGFTLDESIRQQVFTELKSNIENAYQNGFLLIPEIDTSFASRLADNNSAAGFVLPTSSGGGSVQNDSSVENVN
jgi:hypothetical protein